MSYNVSKKQLEKIESVTLEEMNAFIKSHTELSNITFSIVTMPKDEKKK